MNIQMNPAIGAYFLSLKGPQIVVTDTDCQVPIHWVDLGLLAAPASASVSAASVVNPTAMSAPSVVPGSLRRPSLLAIRIQFILWVIRELNMEPMCIPHGKKKFVMYECLARSKDLTENMFAEAWGEASVGGLLCIKNKHRYIK